MAQPFFTSYTPIARMDTRLAGSTGERIGAGLQQGVQAFMAGVERKRMKDEQKKKDDQALFFLQKMAPQLGLDPNDTETLKAGMDGMGGAQAVLAAQAQIQQLQQQRQAAEENRLRFEELQRAIRDNRMEQGAQRSALAGVGSDGVTAQDILGNYARAGGGSVRTAADLAQIGRAIAPAAGPQLVNFGNGIQGVVDPNGNTHIIPQPGTTGGSSAYERILARQVASGKISQDKADELTLKYLEKMSTPSGGDDYSWASGLGLSPEDIKGLSGGASAPSVPSVPGAPAKQGDLPKVSSKAEYDALPPATRFVGPDGKVYYKPEAKVSDKGLSDLVTGG